MTLVCSEGQESWGRDKAGDRGKHPLFRLGLLGLHCNVLMSLLGPNPTTPISPGQKKLTEPCSIRLPHTTSAVGLTLSWDTESLDHLTLGPWVRWVSGSYWHCFIYSHISISYICEKITHIILQIQWITVTCARIRIPQAKVICEPLKSTLLGEKTYSNFRCITRALLLHFHLSLDYPLPFPPKYKYVPKNAWKHHKMFNYIKQRAAFTFWNLQYFIYYFFFFFF